VALNDGEESMTSRLFATAAILSLTVSSPLLAQAAFDPGVQIFDFSEATITPVLAHREIAILGRYVGQDMSYMDVKLPDGTPATISFMAKVEGSERRLGMVTMVLFSPKPEWSMQRRAEVVINFNAQNLGTQAGIQPNGTVYISRYSLTNTGVSQGTLAAELVLLEASVKRLKMELEKP
jgi:hypothetical protein